MVNSLSPELKIKLYEMILARYKDKIDEIETISVSEIKQKIKPNDETVIRLRNKFISEAGILDYNFENDFPNLVQKANEHMQKIANLSLNFTFWLDFQEIEQIGAAQVFNKAVLLVSLLRSFESPDARVLVTQKGRIFVRFGIRGEMHIIAADSGSVMKGQDIMAAFSDDPPEYSLNDTEYENHEN